MRTGSAARSYLRILLGLGLPSIVASFVLATVYGWSGLNIWVFRCSAAGYDADRYLSFCGDASYGDYVHGALFVPTEPEAIESMRRAEVLFLGNSRAEIAFSGDSLASWLTERRIPYYNLSVFGEQDAFPRAIIGRFDLKPRAVVVSVDGFFTNSINIDGKRVMALGQAVEFEYGAKRWVQSVHRKLCSDDPAPICGGRPAQFRSLSDGRVIHVNYPEASVPLIAGSEFPHRTWPHLLNAARAFKEMLEQRGACLVLTAVPSPTSTPEVAARLSAELGVPYVAPEIPNLRAFDGSHMTVETAERWGAALGPMLQGPLSRCGSR